MKKTKSLLFCAALFGCIFTATSQQSSDKWSLPGSKASDNWFISLGAGGNVLLGEMDGLQPVGERIRLGGELSVGKWLNPNFGVRTQIYVGGLRGFDLYDNQTGEYTRSDRTRDPHPTGWYTGDLKLHDNGFWQDFTYESMTLDLMLNLTNLMRGYYREGAPIDVITYLGAGYLHGIKSYTNPTFDGIVGKLGMRLNFNLNNKWAIYLEPQANFTTDQFDGYVGNRGYDAIVNLMAGVQYNINKNFSTIESLSMDEINRLNSKINDQHQMIENQQGILERQQRMINDLEHRTEAPVSGHAPVVVEGRSYLPDYVRFGLNSSVVELVEKAKLEDAASYLKSHPGSKLLLIGYADKKTGSSNHNYELSRRRAEAVAAELSRNGVSQNQVMIKWVGDKEQPYNQNDWNRVVIMVERK